MIKVYYDSQCVLCRRYKQALEFIAKDKITWFDLHATDFTPPEGLSQELLLSDIHMQDEQGSILVGSEALSAIISAIPGSERYSWLMEKDSAKRALETFHETSERLRRRLKKSCPSCHNRRASP